MKIVGLFPLTGNGGIASWTQKFMQTFPNEEFQFTFVDVAPSKPRSGGGGESLLYRVSSGLCTMLRILNELKSLFKTSRFDILHTTTSGNIGSLRDYYVAKLCRKYRIKSIMHCRYGCITEDLRSSGIIGYILRKAMREFDQIWVLDSCSYKTLKGMKDFRDKVFLTPNSIDITEEIDMAPKMYSRVGFVGNLVPSKGIYELVEACVKMGVHLDIVGPGTNSVITRIAEIAGRQYNKSVYVHGKLSNNEAVNLMKEFDIVSLPTYYEAEAFPISIIEAMSLTKMVISCPRAAIKDMLTGLDGLPCGILVEPKSVEAIVNAIRWCQLNRIDADLMCQKGYKKADTCYRKEIVYGLYIQNYKKLLEA